MPAEESRFCPAVPGSGSRRPVRPELTCGRTWSARAPSLSAPFVLSLSKDERASLRTGVATRRNSPPQPRQSAPLLVVKRPLSSCSLDVLLASASKPRRQAAFRLPHTLRSLTPQKAADSDSVTSRQLMAVRRFLGFSQKPSSAARAGRLSSAMHPTAFSEHP